MAEVGIVAHRGASAQAPENTIEAFNLAWSMGADAIEGDFRLSADGRIVCIHDATTKRTCGVDLDVSKTDSLRLRELNANYAKKASDVGVKIPFLEEVLATVPKGKSIFIELKSGVGIVLILLDILNRSEWQGIETFVISFDSEVIKALKSARSDLKAGLLVKFERSGFRLKPTCEDVFRTAEACEADALSVNAHPMLPRDFGEVAAERGFPFHVWTVDAPGWATEMIRRGARSITTNKPDQLLARLKPRSEEAL